MLVGECTKDVNGNDVSERFARLRYSAVAAFGQTVFADSDKALLESTLSQLKIKPNDITNGTRFNHREVVLVQDYSEILCDTAVNTEFAVDGHTVSAEFCGVLAVRLCKDGGLERLAASGLSSLQLDGTDVFRFDAKRCACTQSAACRGRDAGRLPVGVNGSKRNGMSKARQGLDRPLPDSSAWPVTRRDRLTHVTPSVHVIHGLRESCSAYKG